MDINWTIIKEVFFTLGSIAGVLALSKPVFESKYERDKKRFEYISSIINEQMLVDLELSIWNSRRVSGEVFTALGRLCYENEENFDELRFSGPLGKWFKEQLDNLSKDYNKLREFIQVPEWNPYKDETATGWLFNKSAFITEKGEFLPYDKHLSDASDQAILLKHSYQKMQIINEMHLFECIFAKYLLKNRFRSIISEKNKENS